MFVLKEMLPSYHKWRYTSHGVREQIGKKRGKGRSEEFLAPWRISSPFLGARVIKQGHIIPCLFRSSGCLILELIHAILNLCHETDLHSRYEGGDC